MTKTTARNDFATRLHEKLAENQAGKNLFFLPFSIQVALAMCAVGARGKTRTVMADLIGAPESVDEQNRQYAELLKSINENGRRLFELTTANALWGQQGSHLKPKFRQAIVECYDGALKEVNFIDQPDCAVKTINGWVSDKTHQKIKDLIHRNLIDSDTRLILTNAIYFKGKWEFEFKKASTKDENWHGPNGDRTAPMMRRKGNYPNYEDKDFQAVELPYKGGQLSMLVVLPRDLDGLTSLEANWSANDTYRVVPKKLFAESVIVSLPRFKLETEFKLKPIFCEMGAELAFGNEADFSGIGDESLKISEVVHKAFVEVNEEGTEAAAATGAHMSFKSAMPMPKEFKADHPFLFFIRDRNTNTVLFAGRVVDPR